MEINNCNQLLLRACLSQRESNLIDHTIGSEDSHLVREWLGSQSNNCVICRACLKEEGREEGEGGEGGKRREGGGGGRRGREGGGGRRGREEWEGGGGGGRRGREGWGKWKQGEGGGEEMEGRSGEEDGREEWEEDGREEWEEDGREEWEEDGREEWGGRWEGRVGRTMGGKQSREGECIPHVGAPSNSELLKEEVHTRAITPATVLTTFRWEQGGFTLRSDRGSKDPHR